MFRISQYLREVHEAEREGRYPVPARRGSGTPPGPVVIWNLTDRKSVV